MPASTTAMVPHRPMNLPVMNAARLTGLLKSTKTVRFSTSLCTRLAAMNTATMSPKKVTATSPKSFIMRPCSPRLMLPSQSPPAIMIRAKTTMTASTRSRIVSLKVLAAMARTWFTPSPPCMKKSSSVGASASASSTVPVQATRPSRMMAMRVQSSCTSLRMCELKSTVFPRSCRSWMMRLTSTRPTGSSPVMGSSSSTSSGSLISAWAMPTRCSMPLEYLRRCVSAARSRPTSLSRASTRSRLRLASRPKSRAQNPRNSRPER